MLFNITQKSQYEVVKQLKKKQYLVPFQKHSPLKTSQLRQLNRHFQILHQELQKKNKIKFYINNHLQTFQFLKLRMSYLQLSFFLFFLRKCQISSTDTIIDMHVKSI
ncbi:unnamed protein product (macronuclear) [Paramecium tetraurelia]|uniref:Uncharacterized protein n=1 Tax=Paramecium tetraurelia TaxID=5888 RepID=A0CFJ9_PARTE|nr:uncharacterized protein GSPATT00038006001 [Paramecium tetraurelia]CAK69566.1 unnamed protein product [Paramecium tetraurelia]|eukprot:XP_001436963.1 hypothetical protein (macronuclear) [Paramecium tetraurelia strain d4-2]